MRPTLHNRIWLFSIIPVILFIYGVISINFVGYYFLWSADPEYAYLFNGVTLSYFKTHLNCVGHPGTPIQCIIAITAWFVHLFRPGSPLFEDVMMNPELYIRSSLYAINGINFTILFLLGTFIFRNSGNVILALMMQLTPFAFVITMEVSRRLMPESLMVSIVSLWLMLLFKMMYAPEHQINGKKFSLLFAVLFGFSLANKLTFLPYFVIPLFLLPGVKLKIRYVVFSIVFFLLFAFPVLSNFHKFTNWVVGIFTHKGVYGGGEKGILDLTIFYQNALLILKGTYRLTIPLVALNAALIYYCIRSKPDRKLVALSAGITSLIILSFLITAKHYAFYYLTPTLLLTVFIFFLFTEVLNKTWPVIAKYKIRETGIIIFSGFLLVTVVPASFQQLSNMQKSSNELVENHKQINQRISKGPKIISAYYYGCSAPEYSLLFGLHESGRYGRWLTEKYKRLFPDTYIYYPWSGLFYSGVDAVNPASFLESGKTYSLYVAEYSQQRLEQIMASLQQDSINCKINLQEVYTSPSENEAIFNLILSPVKNQK